MPERRLVQVDTVPTAAGSPAAGPPAAGPPVATSASLLSALRLATAAAHADIEGHPLLRPLLSPSLQSRQLARILWGFREFFALLEPGLTAELPAALTGTGYRYHPRVPLLVADIHDLVGEPPVEFGLCRDLRVSPSRNPLGVLYVIEGASQGGRLIAPRLASSLGTTAGWGARYFHLYQEAQWPRLRDVLAREASASPAAPVEAALECFDLLRRVLDRMESTTKGAEDAG